MEGQGGGEAQGVTVQKNCSQISTLLNVDGSEAVSSWYNDQWAVTYLLLKEKICTLPESSTIW
jgi:hypothetical protein